MLGHRIVLGLPSVHLLAAPIAAHQVGLLLRPDEVEPRVGHLLRRALAVLREGPRVVLAQVGVQPRVPEGHGYVEAGEGGLGRHGQLGGGRSLGHVEGDKGGLVALPLLRELTTEFVCGGGAGAELAPISK